jgi:hypothetical protein
MNTAGLSMLDGDVEADGKSHGPRELLGDRSGRPRARQIISYPYGHRKAVPIIGSATVMSIQNGPGHDDIISDIFGRDP